MNTGNEVWDVVCVFGMFRQQLQAHFVCFDTRFSGSTAPSPHSVSQVSTGLTSSYLCLAFSTCNRSFAVDIPAKYRQDASPTLLCELRSQHSPIGTQFGALGHRIEWF